MPKRRFKVGDKIRVLEGVNIPHAVSQPFTGEVVKESITCAGGQELYVKVTNAPNPFHVWCYDDKDDGIKLRAKLLKAAPRRKKTVKL